MADKIYVDGKLITWGEALFRPGVNSRTGKTRSMLGKPGKGAGQGGAISAQGVRDKLRATVKKTPEVNVKITGSGKSMKQIKSHLDYISRNGKLELEDQDGNIIDGKEAVRDLRDDWSQPVGGAMIPYESGTIRETFNIVVSMPKGTDREGVHQAAREFAASQFKKNHDYVFVSHNDTDHPHAHIVVRAMGHDRKRLNPRKSDLQQWRELFAEKLKEHGIDANATRRQVRGVTRRPERRQTLGAVTEGKTLSRRGNVDKAPPQTHDKVHAKVINNYKELVGALQQSPDVEDRKLALSIVQHIDTMPAERRHRAKTKGTEIDKKQPGRDRGDKDRGGR